MAIPQSSPLSFAEIVGPLTAGSVAAEELRIALQILGPDAKRPLAELTAPRRAELVDKLTRATRSLSVAAATELHHRLLHAVDAEPRGAWQATLDGPVSLVELRNHVKYVLTALGLPWSAISRMQAGICGLGRWIVSEGGGEALVTVDGSEVRFVMTMTASGLGDALLAHSPISSAVKDSVQGFQVAHTGPIVRFEFIVRA